MHDDTINADVTMSDATTTLLAKRYRVVRQLGQGGMGSVWLAEDLQLDNHKVAIKMLPSVLIANTRAYQQLKSEALVSLKLTHPNIAAVRAFEENGGNPFLVVDFIDGETLDDYLADRGKISEDEAARILQPIAAALDYAHSAGVVHRDVKPGNVMIAKDGSPYILDFGIAREIQETMTRVTGKLSSGTLLYMSPEQLRGAEPTVAQDVYSFAAMAYECLAGAPPFSRGQIEYQILNELPEPLDPQFAKLGSGIMAGLAKDPSMRPTSCDTVLSPRKTHSTCYAHDPSLRTGGSATKREEQVFSTGSVGMPKHLRLPSKRMLACSIAAVGVLTIVGVAVHSLIVRRAERMSRIDARAAEEQTMPIVERVRELSTENGFARRISEVERVYENAKDQFRGRKFARAKASFEEAAAAGRRLLESDAERQRCQDAYCRAKEARSRGRSVYARQDAPLRWKGAEKDFAEGRRQRDDGKFVAASMLFARAREDFNDACAEAVRNRKERDREECERRDRAGESAIAAIRQEAWRDMAKCRELNGDLTNRVAVCERLYADAERLKSEKNWSEAANAYTNVVATCRNVLLEDGRRRKTREERRARAEKANRERELAQKRIVSDGRRRAAELPASSVQTAVLNTVGDFRIGDMVELTTTGGQCARGAYKGCKGGGVVIGYTRGRTEVTSVYPFSDIVSVKRVEKQIVSSQWQRDAVKEFSIVGKWTATYTRHMEGIYHQSCLWTLTLKNDGTFVSQRTFRGTTSGTWKLANSKLILICPGWVSEYRVIRRGSSSFELRFWDVEAEIERIKSKAPIYTSLSYDAQGNEHLKNKSGFLGLGSEQDNVESPKIFRKTAE